MKDNNTFIDTEGDTVLIALWNDSIHQVVQHDSGYTISHVMEMETAASVVARKRGSVKTLVTKRATKFLMKS